MSFDLKLPFWIKKCQRKNRKRIQSSLFYLACLLFSYCQCDLFFVIISKLFQCTLDTCLLIWELTPEIHWTHPLSIVSISQFDEFLASGFNFVYFNSRSECIRLLPTKHLKLPTFGTKSWYSNVTQCSHANILPRYSKFYLITRPQSGWWPS